MESAHPMRHRDSSSESPATKTGASGKPRESPAMESAHPVRHRHSSDESPATNTGASDKPRGSAAMESAHPVRHRDSSNESPAMKTGASDKPRESPAMESAHPVRHRDSSNESPAMNTGASDAPSQFVRRIAVRRIVADHREAPSGVPKALATHSNVELTIHRLRLGDYSVNDTLIVERKTLTDFAQSIRDGRLFTQASRLARVKRARPCLILEGTRINHWSGALPRSAVQGAIITVTLVFGLPVLRSASPEETASLILYATDQLSRCTINPPKRYGYHPKGTNRQQSYLLQAIPGIGPTRAKLLLDTFGSPFGVASATIKDLQAVEGIGASAATNIHQVFHGPKPAMK
jgi:ERCC4-type nuclease